MSDKADTLLLDKVYYSYGKIPGLRSVSLNVREGEFVSVIGPSGCGKSTLLKVMCGALTPQRGEVMVRGRSMRRLSPRDHRVVMVWQSLALFPHLSVGDNVGFGLLMKKVPSSEVVEKVGAVLEVLGLTGYQGRDIASLSGGEQQRVALARAMVVQPSALLLDEPMRGLDRHLRSRVGDKIRVLHREFGVTTVMSTHDQDDALSMADRIIVMRDGGLEQVGSPVEVAGRPATGFVARFVGDRNVLAGEVVESADNGMRISTKGGMFRGRKPDWRSDGDYPSRSVAYVVESHKVRIGGGTSESAAGRVSSVLTTGLVEHLKVETGTLGVMKLQRPVTEPGVPARVGDNVVMTWSSDDAYVLPSD